MMRMSLGKKAILVILSIAIVLIPMVTVYAQSNPSNSVTVSIDGSGVAQVSIQQSIPSGTSNVYLPAQPISSTIIVSPSNVSWFQVGNAIVVVSSAETTITINYIASTKIENGVISLNISVSSPWILVASPNILLLSVPDNIISYSRSSDGTQTLVINGSATIQYTVLPSQAATTPIISTTVSPQTITTTSTAPASSASPTQGAPVTAPTAPIPLSTLLIIAAVVIIVVAIAVAIAKK